VTTLRGLVRDRDIDTSWDAAARQYPKKREVIARVILNILHTQGAMSDERIWAHYEEMRKVGRGIPMTTPQAVRTIRHRLHYEGLVRDTGRRVRTQTGRTAAVWQCTRSKKTIPTSAATDSGS
jgi:hypothetical protein